MKPSLECEKQKSEATPAQSENSSGTRDNFVSNTAESKDVAFSEEGIAANPPAISSNHSPKNMYCGASLTEIPRDTRSLSRPDPFVEPGALSLVNCAHRNSVPDPANLPESDEAALVIRDTVTGAVYNLHSASQMLESVGKLTTFESSSANQPWEEWWAAKKDHNSQLLTAAEVGDVDRVRELLDAKKHGELIADVNVKELDDFTALHYAVSERHLEVAQVLVTGGANVNAVSTALRTPLHIACYRGNKEMIMYLLSHEANINLQEKEGNTPAHILAECGWQEPLAWLLTQKPDLTIKNAYGMSAQEAAANVEIHKLFQQCSSAGEKEAGYSRTVVDNMILHNNRADVIKSLMFKAQILATQGAPMTSISSEEKKVVPGKDDKKRRVKIIEATRKMENVKTEKLKPRKERKASEDSEEAVGPEYFQPIQQLGKGSFGEVYLVKYKPTGKLYAMKVLNKGRFMSQNLLKYAMTERNVLCFTKHPFIVGLEFAFQTSEKLFLILDYCPGYVRVD